MRKTTACKRKDSFRTVSWKLAGLVEDSLEPFLACARMTMLWDAMLLQETFRKLGGLETEGCQIFTPGNLPGRGHGGWRCPAIIVQSRISEECVFLESGFKSSVDQRSFAHDQSSSGGFQCSVARTRAINPEVSRSRSDFGNRCQHEGFQFWRRVASGTVHQACKAHVKRERESVIFHRVFNTHRSCPGKHVGSRKHDW